MTLSTTALTGLRATFAVALLTLTAACSSSPMAPTAAGSVVASAAATDAKGSDGPGTPAAPAVFAGVWLQEVPAQLPQANGGSAQAWVQLSMTQKGSTLSGEARRFISTWDANGNPVWVMFDLGSPGKVSGTVTGGSASVVVRAFAETKVNFTLALTASADGTRLTNATPNNYGITAFVKR